MVARGFFSYENFLPGGDAGKVKEEYNRITNLLTNSYKNSMKKITLNTIVSNFFNTQ